jgi:hypothetical protein
MMHRLLTLGPDNEPLRVRLYVHPSGTAGPRCPSAMMFPHTIRAR